VETRGGTREFLDELFHMVSCIPQNEMVVLAGDMNGHVGSNNVSYYGTNGGFWYGAGNADGSRILEFTDGLNVVICKTLFMKQKFKLVTYVAGFFKVRLTILLYCRGQS